MPILFELAVAKTHKFGTHDSGDTVELVERPGGGFSAVVVDGQGSGAAAKRLSLQVAGAVVRLLNEGVRDGAAARAAHDFLVTMRGGRVSAALDILSVDLTSRSVVVTRNSGVPMLLGREGDLVAVAESGERIGIYRHTRPLVLEYPVEPGLTAILVTDGVIGAGTRRGRPLDLVAAADVVVSTDRSAQEIADGLLDAALAADDGHPGDDMTVVALRLRAVEQTGAIRRVVMTVPLDP
ncbi:MAG: SpoIIE family protein phosphatase [Sphaerobacter sp.]|nr:SpoIIE family protein phosphatase [Sphaerobacter sp.]